MTITGKLPRIIVDTLGKLGVVIDDIITGGDDIDVIIEDTSLVGTFIGNGKWEVTELDDISNLFPELSYFQTKLIHHSFFLLINLAE